MAKMVTSVLTPTQLSSYGNVILNGYSSTVPNTVNKKAWQYKETATAPINLPSLPKFTPAAKGWTTNYQEYFTGLAPNAYGVNPGDPTMFEYTVHSFAAGSPRWAQPPHRAFMATYSFLYPVVDRSAEPPIGSL